MDTSIEKYNERFIESLYAGQNGIGDVSDNLTRYASDIFKHLAKDGGGICYGFNGQMNGDFLKCFNAGLDQHETHCIDLKTGKHYEYKRIITEKLSKDIDKLASECSVIKNGKVVSHTDIRYVWLKDLIPALYEEIKKLVGTVYVFNDCKVFVRQEAFMVEFFVYMVVGTEIKS